MTGCFGFDYIEKAWKWDGDFDTNFGLEFAAILCSDFEDQLQHKTYWTLTQLIANIDGDIGDTNSLSVNG